MLTGGTLDVTVSKDGKKAITSDGTVRIDGGKTRLSVSGGVDDSDLTDLSASSGIKADTTFVMTGGSLVVTNSGQGGKGISGDVDALFSGGTLVAIGGLENGANLSQACYQADWNKDTWYALYADDKPVFAFKTPERGGNSLVVSTAGTPALKSGVSVSGGTSLFDGLGAVDGSVSGGSAVTLSAYAGGMGGPGGGAPGGGPGR